MVPNITTILQRFTGEWAARLQPEAILTVYSEIGYTAWYDRLLMPVTTMPLCLLQILHGHRTSFVAGSGRSMPDTPEVPLDVQTPARTASPVTTDQASRLT